MRRLRRLSRLALSDDFRGGVPVGAATVVAIAVTLRHAGSPDQLRFVLITACAAFTGAFLIYLLWTHLLFTRMEPPRARALARAQFHRRPSRWARTFAFGSSEEWAIWAALVAFVGSIAVSVCGVRGGAVGVTVAALVMAATAWALVAYTYALRYFRIHSGEGAFDFDFEEEPVFADFLSFALMVSAAGSHVPAVPTTRTGVRAMRSHTVIAFMFNSLVIAVTVSLITNLVTSFGA